MHHKHNKHHHSHERAARFSPTVDSPVQKKGDMLMFTTQCTVEEKVLIHLNPTTKSGKPARLDGSITVTVQSGSGSAELQPDGLSFFAVSPDTPGETVYLVDGDADLGSGVADIQDTVILTATGVNAENLGITAEAPVQK